MSLLDIELKVTSCVKCGRHLVYNEERESIPNYCDKCKENKMYLDNVGGWEYYYMDSDW